jgi:hypothetical protein
MKYILVAFIFLSCNHIERDAPFSRETLDTIRVAPPKIIAAPGLFETAFIKGTPVKVSRVTATLYGITIGKIKLPAGRVIACDPLHIDEYGKPYTQQFPVGEFPVQLSIANVDNKETIAFARIYFSDEPVIKWELALLEGQKPLPVGGKEIHGYATDGSVGIFVDAEAVKALDIKTIQRLEGRSDLFKELIKHNHNNWNYAMYNFGKNNMAAFSSGVGDGTYASYIGFDAGGKPCRLLTDFDLFDWKKN